MTVSSPRASTSQILVTIAAFIIVVAGMRASATLLVPFLLAAFITIICTPALFFMQRKGLPSWLALIIVVIGILGVGFLVSALVGSSVRDFTRDLPVYESKLQQQIATVETFMGRFGVDTSMLALTEVFDPGAAMKMVASSLNSLGRVLTNTFLILMTVVFMLLEAAGLPAKLRTIMGAEEGSLDRLGSIVDNVKQYMAIKTWISLGTGILIALWSVVMGVSYPILWGVVGFLLNFVPNIGSIIAAIPVVLLAVIQIGVIQAIVVAAGFVVINLLMGSVIEPRFMGRGLGLSTLVVFLSLLFWGWVLGPVGMLLSVPLTIIAKIALDSREETRWLAILLGPDVSSCEWRPPDAEEGKASNG